MFFEILGMITAAMVPAVGAASTAASIGSAIKYADKAIEEYLPPEFFDETEYYPQHLIFTTDVVQRMGLSGGKCKFSVAWSKHELGEFALFQNWVLTGQDGSSSVKQSLRDLLRIGEDRFKKMCQSK